MKLYDYQLDALGRMKNGCILNGGVGSGKSLTAISYYYLQNGGKDSFLKGGNYIHMKNPKDLYIITTAKKRDTLEWEKELIPFLLYSEDEKSYYKNKVVIDSWNNIKKYKEIKDAFFIFDEQRVVGYGEWTQSFLNIAKHNKWILLSATPGDTWMDYMPVFIANGFYRNKTDFVRKHVVYKPRVKFPMIDRYLDTGKLQRYRRSILVNMDFERQTVAHHEDIPVTYDKDLYKKIMKDKWNPWEKKPIKNAGELCYLLRKVVNSAPSRELAVLELVEDHPKVIIFYNFDYELEILKALNYGDGVKVSEWNGHKHEKLPSGEKWVYLVQYSAGSEGWNCITTDTIIFYSQSYSYKVAAQACGRIDRLNTPYTDLYYYHLKSSSTIDLSIARALKNKKNFNIRAFTNPNH